MTGGVRPSKRTYVHPPHMFFMYCSLALFSYVHTLDPLPRTLRMHIFFPVSFLSFLGQLRVLPTSGAPCAGIIS